MLFTIERWLPHPTGQKVGPIGRNTSRNRLVRELTEECRVALPQFLGEPVTLGDLGVSGARLDVSA
jgi:hypothetical protein